MIERLTASTPLELARIGGKASGLVRLLTVGLTVPEAWVLSAEVSLDEERKQQCLATDLPEWWAGRGTEFPNSRWAVRSSAVAEDLGGASFAGVYETVLGVDSLDALVGAVEKCWESVAQDRAARYLDTQGMNSDAGIALVLQRMIEADAAGVMLTENPLRPFADEVVIDAAWGLGESVVSGRTDPDHIVLQRNSGEVLHTRLGAKQVEIVWADGIVERAVPEDRRVVRCLTDEQLTSLHTVAVQVSAAIGPRRDLEWASEGDRLFVLQDRPITGLPPREPKQVWSRRFGDEYLAEYTTPLGHDLMGTWLVGPNIDEVAQLQGRPEIVAMEKLRRHDGYIYLNGDYALELIRSVPVDARADTPLVAWFDPVFCERLMAVPFEPLLLIRTLAASRKDRRRGGVRANLAALQQHCTAVEVRIVPKLRQNYRELTDEQWRAQFAEADGFGQDHFRVIRWGMGQHGPVLRGLLGKLLTGSADSVQTLISGLPGTHTAAINRAIWELGTLGRDDPALLDGLRAATPHLQLRESTAHSKFWRHFDMFLTEHGHRSATREISAQRWHEQPDVVLALVRAHVRGEAPSPDPAEFEVAAQARRMDEERRLRAELGRVRRTVFDPLVALVQDYTVYRENQRYHLDYILDHLRQLLLEQGRRLTERGFLQDRSEVFLLTGATFSQLVWSHDHADRDAVAAEVAEARAHRERFASRLPAAYLFDGVPTEGRASAPGVDADGALVGFGASAGQAVGVVRVVTGLPDLASVERGEVLLASNIDPGWTSVFPLIAGLITETGGILSHGAILAREYGIPTVTSLDGALSLLPGGARVRVDGSAGTVTVLD
ncbi:PEP/pyruvate-binding domain-containing protein [Nocardia sp. NPDC058518]|uniref:PEP/pyruvate-binding domain-containing protein n=1 Tax=Nocardia sp. NPDC058518 TaxID=3346534 RepID=UPI003658DDBA